MKYVTEKECNKNEELVAMTEFNIVTKKDNYIAKNVIIDVPFEDSLVYNKYIDEVKALNIEEVKAEILDEIFLTNSIKKVKENCGFEATNLIISIESHKKYSKLLKKFNLEVFIDNRMGNDIYLYKKNSMNHSGFMLFRFEHLYKLEQIGINIEKLFLKIVL